MLRYFPSLLVSLERLLGHPKFPCKHHQNFLYFIWYHCIIVPLPNSSPTSKVALEKLAMAGSSTSCVLRLFFRTTTNRIIAQVIIPNKSNLHVRIKRCASYIDKTIIIVPVPTVAELDSSYFVPVVKRTSVVKEALVVAPPAVVSLKVVTVFSEVVTCKDVNSVVDCELEVWGEDVMNPEVSD